MLEDPLQLDTTFPWIPTVREKSYPHSRLVKNAKAINPNHKKLSTYRKVLLLSCFDHKPSAKVQNVEKAIADYAEHYPVKPEPTLSELNTPSIDHILACDVVFEHTYLHLILIDNVYPTGVENLSKSSKAFTHSHIMLSHLEPNTVSNYSKMTQVTRQTHMCLSSAD